MSTSRAPPRHVSIACRGSRRVSLDRARASISVTVIGTDRKSTRLNSSHTVISPLPLHDALPIFRGRIQPPFEHVAFDEKSTRDLTLLLTLSLGTNVDQQGSASPRLHRLSRLQARQSRPGSCKHLSHRHRYRSEEHTSELQSHSDLPSSPTRRSSDLPRPDPAAIRARCVR